MSTDTFSSPIKALSHLRDGAQDAASLVLHGAVGPEAATAFLAWNATADLADPREVLANPTGVDWLSMRVDQMFAVANAVVALSLADDNRRTWKQAMNVMVAIDNAGRPDVALAAVPTLFGQTHHLRAGLTDRQRRAFGGLLTRMGVMASADEVLA